MINPHKLVSKEGNVLEVLVRVCVECSHPVIEVPDEIGGWYCIYCEYYPSMQNTRMQKIYITKGEKAA